LVFTVVAFVQMICYSFSSCLNLYCKAIVAVPCFIALAQMAMIEHMPAIKA